MDTGGVRTGPAYGSDALFFLYSQIGPVANEICRRWDVSDPFDPSWEFDLNGERYEKGSCIGLPSFPYIKGYQIWDFEELDPSLPSSDDERLALLLKGVPDGIERPSWKDTTDRRLIRLEFDVTKSLETNIEELTRGSNWRAEGTKRNSALFRITVKTRGRDSINTILI